MSFIGSMLSNSKGAGYEAEKGTVLNPASLDQSRDQYANANKALENQAAFVQATGGVNGLNNQYNLLQQQQGLADRLYNQSQGQGPNPAQAQLAQNTANNVSQQAALMGSQRGSGANAGMLGRQIGQQGAAIEQQGIGQAATLQAQQQLAANQQLAAQQQAMQQVAGQQVGQQAGALMGYNQSAQNEQQNVLNAISQQNNANMGMQSNINNANAGIAAVNAGNQGKLLGGVLGGLGSALMPAAGGAMAHGGVVQNFVDGGDVKGPQSFFGRALAGAGFNQNNQGGPNSDQPQAPVQAFTAQDPLATGSQQFGKGLGSRIGSMFSPAASAGGASAGVADVTGPAIKAFAFNSGGMADRGGKVGGTAKVPGDSLKNDTVPTVLSPGEIVLPRSVTTHPNAPEEAMKFVAAVMAKRGLK